MVSNIPTESTTTQAPPSPLPYPSPVFSPNKTNWKVIGIAVGTILLVGLILRLLHIA